MTTPIFHSLCDFDDHDNYYIIRSYGRHPRFYGYI